MTDDGPLVTATDDLVAWLQDTCGTDVHLGAPSDADDEGMSLWPYELRAEQQLSSAATGAGRHPYRFSMRYVISAAGADISAGLRLLDSVIVAAVRSGDRRFELATLDPAVWLALAIRPRPVVFVEASAQVNHAVVEVPRVLAPLGITQIPLRTLSGEVRGPNGQQVAALPVELVGTPLRTVTDHHGRFRFNSVPGAPSIELKMTGRGRTFTATLDLAALPEDELVVIHCDFGAVLDPGSRLSTTSASAKPGN